MIDGFFLKKLVSMFVHVIPGALFLLLLLLFAHRWWPRFCNRLAIVVVCCLLLGSAPPVSNYFVSKLENQYPVLQLAPPDTAVVLVLGSSHIYEQNRPANSTLISTALSRLAEGVRLWRTQPESYLALSGGYFGSPISHASAMQKMALEFDVPAERILLFEQTRDTEDEVMKAMETMQALSAVNLSSKNQSGEDQTVDIRNRLVVASSAIHLPRAAMMLDKQGAKYSMSPANFIAADKPWYRPSISYLSNLDRAIHELIGMAWYRLRNL